MEFWNLPVHRVDAITEILREDNLVRHCSQLVIQNDRNLGATSLALSEPFRSFHRPWVQEATKRFMTLWWPHVRPVWTQRLRQLLHLGAACMALGIVLGLYIRGLALDYRQPGRARFSLQTKSRVSSTLFWVLPHGSFPYPFPELSEILSLQAPQHGAAAPWIHMWAVTALAVIVIPRSIMAWMCQRSLNQARQTFVVPMHDSYFVHLLAPDRGQGVHVDILPYSYQPSPRAKDFLDLGFLDLFGNLATIQWQLAMPFGQEIPTWPEVSTLTRTFVVIFNAGTNT